MPFRHSPFAFHMTTMKKQQKVVYDQASGLAAGSPHFFQPEATDSQRTKSTRLEERSNMAKEKLADSLMTLGNIIYGAVFVAMLVFPVTAFVSAMYQASDPFSFLAPVNQFSWQRIMIFVMAFIIPLAVAMWARRKAMDLYDEIDDNTR